MARTGKPLKRLMKELRERFTWLKPGENESAKLSKYESLKPGENERLLWWLKPAETKRLRWFPSRRFFAAILLLILGACSITELPSLTVGLLTQAQNQPQSQPQPTPSPSPAPSPSTSPTPPPNLHQWGAVTSFHGLPSDRTHAIAQTEFGVTWFATDGGLARFDGRRTSAVTADGLPTGRVLALKADQSGALWIGTENGAARLFNDTFETIKETAGKVITAIITPDRDHAIMASEAGQIFDCRSTPTLTVRAIPEQPLQSTDKDQPGALKLTSLALIDGTLYAGTQSRGLVEIQNGQAKEIVSKPRSFFI